MSDNFFNNRDLAAAAEFGAFQSIQNNAANKVVRAIEGLKTQEQDNPLKKRYKLLAANGCDLIAQCGSCNQYMRFLPEYAGETAECIHCQKAVVLCRQEDLLSTQCRTCNATFKYFGYTAPLVCANCGPKHLCGMCPHCKKEIIFPLPMSDPSKLICPNSNCNGKIQMNFAWMEKRGNGLYHLNILKRGFFS